MEQTTRTPEKASRPFDMDVKAIRAKARQDIESGAVTDTYRADRETVLKLLNEALAIWLNVSFSWGANRTCLPRACSSAAIRNMSKGHPCKT